MRIYGDTDQIWNFILFLYRMEEHMDLAVQKDLQKCRKLIEKLDQTGQGKKSRDFQERLGSEAILLKKRTEEFRETVSKAEKRMNRYLLFLEEIIWEQEYYEYKKQVQNGSDTGADISVYRKIHFRGTDFYIAEGTFELEQMDALGRTNLQRMKQGLAPVGTDGMYVNLHHMIQQEAGGIIEIPESAHKKGHKVLHINPSSVPSGINRKAFAVLRRNYWKWRAGFEEQRRRDSERKTDQD